MKKIYLACMISIVVCTVALSQNPTDTTAAKKKEEVTESSEKPSLPKPDKADSKPASTDTTVVKKEKAADSGKSKTEDKAEVKDPPDSSKTDTTKEAKEDVKKTDESEIPENPFLTGEEETAVIETEQADDSETPENPFLTGVETVSADEPIEEAEVGGVDIIVDLGLGVSLSRFFIEPEDVTTEGKPSFLFNPGVIIPFAKRFFAGVAIRYMQLSVDLSISYSTIDNDYPSTSVKTNTNEIMTYVSVPIKLGMRFELNKATPYFYADIEPAYLTGSNQFIATEIKTIFTDGSEYFIASEKNTKDMETTGSRKREQIFIGGGIGIELPYGYGSVYIDGGCKYGVFDTDISEEQGHSIPWRNAGRVIYFPVSLGIRFFL